MKKKILNVIFTVNIIIWIIMIFLCHYYAELLNHGSALIGKIENGHYYIGHYLGKFQEVNPFDWYVDLFSIIILFVTTLILMISGINFFYVMFFKTMINKVKDSKDPLKKNNFKW